MGNDNVIEFNGKRYDALTGEVLGKSRAEVVEPLAAPRPAKRRNIDGVVRHKRGSGELLQSRGQPAGPWPVTAKHPRTHRSKPAVIKAHRPEAAKTLMRRTVHKPNMSIKPAIKPRTPAEVMAKPISAIAVKHSVHRVSPERKQRAQQTPKSHAVKHFIAHSSGAPHVAILPAHVAPIHQTPRPQAVHHTKPDIFEAAIARANSHEQPPVTHRSAKHRKHRKVAGILAGLAALLLLGGFWAYLNMATIELKVASMQAGFTAQLPSHEPTGYELTNIQNRPGQIVLEYHSGDRHYQITQQPTDWNSRTLGESIIADANSQPIQTKGRTIYVYNGVASWVSGGVRYDLTNNASFSVDEIAAIAGSM